MFKASTDAFQNAFSQCIVFVLKIHNNSSFTNYVFVKIVKCNPLDLDNSPFTLCEGEGGGVANDISPIKHRFLNTLTESSQNWVVMPN